MESHFERIVDVTRLQKGDLIVVPTEIKNKRKKLHVSISTYRKMGLSVGDTCRSTNDYNQVRSLLEADPGCSRALYVSSVFTGYTAAREASMLRFIGNDINSKPRLPEVDYVNIHEFPLAFASTTYTRLWFLRSMLESASDMLLGKLSYSLFFCSMMNTEHVEDECISFVYDNRFGHEDFKDRCINSTVPCTSKKHPDTMMPKSAIEDFLSSSNLFDSEKYRTSKDNNWRNPKGEIHASRKFLIELSKRGALFIRPSATALYTALSSIISERLKEYQQRCLDIIKSGNDFIENLKLDVERAQKKIKDVDVLRAELDKQASDKEVLNQFKEVMKW